MEHPAIQKIMSDHELSNVQNDNQIKNWIYGEVNLALDKIETASEVPSKEIQSFNSLRPVTNFLPKIDSFARLRNGGKKAKCS